MAIGSLDGKLSSSASSRSGDVGLRGTVRYHKHRRIKMDRRDCTYFPCHHNNLTCVDELDVSMVYLACCRPQKPCEIYCIIAQLSHTTFEKKFRSVISR
jgi:hypothetical protein